MNIRTSSANAPFFAACNSPEFCYAPGNAFAGAIIKLKALFPDSKPLPYVVEAVAGIALVYSCRATELLSLTIADVLSGDRVHVKAAKGSADYIVFMPGICEQIAHAKNASNSARLFPLTYHQLYCALRRAGISTTNWSRKNKAVTHAFRYLFAREAEKKIDLNSLRDCMRHRSAKSTLQYGARGA